MLSGPEGRAADQKPSFEATITPAFVLIISMWYRRNEQAVAGRQRGCDHHLLASRLWPVWPHAPAHRIVEDTVHSCGFFDTPLLAKTLKLATVRPPHICHRLLLPLRPTRLPVDSRMAQRAREGHRGGSHPGQLPGHRQLLLAVVPGSRGVFGPTNILLLPLLNVPKHSQRWYRHFRISDHQREHVVRTAIGRP
jgi:hypothetical protein